MQSVNRYKRHTAPDSQLKIITEYMSNHCKVKTFGRSKTIAVFVLYKIREDGKDKGSI